MTTILWHYTVGVRLAAIVKDGMIRQATANVPKGERPAVWFSASEQWEETANKLEADDEGQLTILDRRQTEEAGQGLFRIGVAPETAPHDWNAWKKLSGASVKTVNVLRAEAYRIGSRPSNWFVSFDPIPRSQWLAVQQWDGQQWTKVDAAQIRMSLL